MTDVKQLRIAKNKIDRIEDFSFPSQNLIGSIILEGKVFCEILEADYTCFIIRLKSCTSMHFSSNEPSSAIQQLK